jgi:hypothetical protein
MMRYRLSTVAAALLVATSAPPASAALISPEVVGSWTGKLQCNEYNGGVKEKATATPTMRISQVGANFLLELDFGNGNTQNYGGLLNPDVKKPEKKADAILIRCGTNNQIGDHPNAMGRMTISGKPGKVKASFKGFSIFSDETAPSPDHGTCKWKFTRIDTVDPNLPDTTCPLPGLQGGGAL